MNVHKIKAEIKIILLAVLIGVITTTFYTLKVFSEETVNSISNKIVRFRVLPNSNNDYDQALKLIVKDSVMQRFEQDLNSFSNNEDALNAFNNKLEEIKSYTEKIIHKYGYDYNVNVKVDLSSFPTKTYGNVTLPNGQYTTLIIEIGEATGNNWWCVMYPPLCFVDETMETIPSEIDDELQKALSPNEYQLITSNEIQYNVKFKIVEMFN